MPTIMNINCKWYDSYGRCDHSDQKKFLWIFKKSCPLTFLYNKKCELQEMYPKPEGMLPDPPPVPGPRVISSKPPIPRGRCPIDYRSILRGLYK